MKFAYHCIQFLFTFYVTFQLLGGLDTSYRVNSLRNKKHQNVFDLMKYSVVYYSQAICFLTLGEAILI